MRVSVLPRFLILRLSLLALLIPLAYFGSAPHRALSAEDGVISGRIVMGTEGGAIEQPLTVELAIYRNGQYQETRTSTVADGSAYRFEGLATGPDYQYVPFLRSEGVLYSAPQITLESDRAGTAEITVYEATEDASVVSIMRNTLVIAGAEKESERLSILEFVQFENASDRTFVPNTTGAAGPMGLLRFGLAPGTRDLQPDDQLAAYEMVAVDAGFANSMPIRPGNTQVSFSYDVDYGGVRAGKFTYEKSVAYPTAQVLVLVADQRLQIASPALADRGTVTIGDKTYRRYESGGPVRDRLVMTIGGLPGSFPFDPTGPVVRYGGLVLAATLGGLALFLGFVKRGTIHAPALSHHESEQIEGARGGEILSKDSLLLEVARLDVEFEQARIPEDVYRRERSLRKRQLVELVRQETSRRRSVAAESESPS